MEQVPAEANKELVRRLLDDVLARHDLGALDEVAEGVLAETARRWISRSRVPSPTSR